MSNDIKICNNVRSSDEKGFKPYLSQTDHCPSNMVNNSLKSLYPEYNDSEKMPGVL